MAITALGRLPGVTIASVRIFLDILSLLQCHILVNFEGLFKHELVGRFKLLLRAHFTPDHAEHGLDLVGRVSERVRDGDLRLLDCVFDACCAYFGAD